VKITKFRASTLGSRDRETQKFVNAIVVNRKLLPSLIYIGGGSI